MKTIISTLNIFFGFAYHKILKPKPQLNKKPSRRTIFVSRSVSKAKQEIYFYWYTLCFMYVKQDSFNFLLCSNHRCSACYYVTRAHIIQTVSNEHLSLGIRMTENKNRKLKDTSWNMNLKNFRHPSSWYFTSLKI